MLFTPFQRSGMLLAASLVIGLNSADAAVPTSSGAASVLAAPESSFHGSLGVSSLSYMAQPGLLKRSQFTIGRLHFSYHRIGNELEIHADSRIGVGVDCGADCSSVEFSELSIGSSRRLAPLSFHLGRVLNPWSALDDTWKLGIYQPRFIYDFLHPQQVGLLGGFVRFAGTDWRVTGFASPGFIPDRGLPVNVENGRIASIDPFFHAPISEVIYEGKNTPVAYSVNRPPLSQMLMRPAMGVSAQWGSDGDGLGVSASYAYKPINQILLAYNNLYNLSFEVADADLYPRVLMHHVGGLDLKYSRKRVGGALSVVREVPIMDEVPAQWTSQQLGSAWLLSPSVMVRGEKTFQASAAYLHVEGGNAPDKLASGGPNVGDGVSVFEKRYPYSSAFRFTISDELWRRASRAVNWRSQVLLDLEHSSHAFMHS
ncbi:MAG: hypothetical protein KGQ59_06280, partial [Bdellovibrionales bacterium]|nr:hypothetical protein [Bdellovibrionales bacterium]